MVQTKSVEAILKARDSNFTSTFGKAASMMEKFAGKTNSTSSTIKGIVSSLGIYKVASAGVSLVTGQMSNAFSRADTMQNFSRNMTVMVGSAQSAKSMLSELNTAAKGTSYGLDAVAKTAQGFSTAGQTIDKATRNTKNFMNAVSFYGNGTSEQLSQVTLQMQQMAAKGRANMGDLNSAVQAGIPVYRMYAEATGQSTEDVMNALSNGQISAEDFFDTLDRVFNEGTASFPKISNAAKEAGASWQGSFDNMRAATTRGVLSMINSVDTLSQKLTGASLKDHVSNLGKSIEDSLTTLSNKLQVVGNSIKPYVDEIKNAFSGVGTSVLNAIKSVFSAMGELNSSFGSTQSIKSFGDVMKTVADKIKQVASFIQDHNVEIAKLIPVVAKVIAAYKGFQIISSLASPFVKFADTAVSSVTGIVPKVSSSFKTLATDGTTSIRSLASALLKNPINIALLAITAAVVAMAAAWTSNFGNIRGFVTKAFESMKPAINSIINSFKLLGKTLSPLMPVLKAIGALLMGTIVFAIAAVIDAISVVIFLMKSIVNLAVAVGKGLEGVWKKIKGDSEGSNKAFKEAGKSLNNIKDDFKSGWDNSAIRGAINSTSELGKKTDNASESQKKLTAAMDSTKESAEKLSQTFSKLNQETQDAFQRMSEAFQDNQPMQEFNQKALKLVEDGGKQRLSAIDKYNDELAKSEGKSQNERQTILQTANRTLMSEMQKSRSDLIASYDEMNKMLVTNTDITGQQMTQSQRTAMIETRNATLSELSITNQTYVDKLRERISMGDTVSREETTIALENLRDLNTRRITSIQENNAEIQKLREAQNATDDTLQKAAYDQQIIKLEEANGQLVQEQNKFGETWLALRNAQGEKTAEQLATALSNEKNLTDENLLSILESYKQSGAKVEEQMTLLAAMLESKGVEGSQKLSEALKNTSDLQGIANSMTQDIQNGLMSLPPSMFRDGEQGRQRFVEALKSGDVKTAGTYLVDGVSQETAKLQQKLSDHGRLAGEIFNKKISESKVGAKNAANEVSIETTNALKAKTPDFVNAGSENGRGIATGINQQKPTLYNAGAEVMQNAKNGASSVGGFSSIGSNMVEGIAAGIRHSAGGAVAAMQGVISQINAEAQKKAEIHSPSRLFKREVGSFLSLGIAEGIKDKASVAVDSMRDLINDVAEVGAKGSVGLEVDLSGEISGANNSLIAKVDELIMATREKLVVDGATVIGGHPDTFNQVGYRNIRDERRLSF